MEEKGNWLTIWLNRPEKRNALSKNLIEELASVLSICERNRSLRGIIFRGKGSTFCAGADLKWMQNIALNKEVSAEAIHNMSCMFGDIFENISKMSPITISVVEGSSMAGGIGVMCATDLIITMADTNFSLTETKIGLTPAQIAPYVINKVGFQQAKKTVSIPKFNKDSAYYFVKNQVDFGPRFLSSKGWANCSDWLEKKLKKYADTLIIQTAPVTTYDQKQHKLKANYSPS